MTVELNKLTPMMRQFFEIKETVGEAILFFRMGDFFEIFGADAEDVAPKLDLVLTARERGDQQKIPFCGVPHHSAKSYWLKLVKWGYKVAICEQLEDPSDAKGLVKRGVTRVYTPGSIDELEGLEQDQANFMMGWMDLPSHNMELVTVVDTSTGEFRLGQIEKGSLIRYVKQFRPSELVVRRFSIPNINIQLKPWLADNQLRIEQLPEAPLKDSESQKSLLAEVFGAKNLENQPCGDVGSGEILVAGVLAYLKSLNASTRQFMRIDPLEEADTVALSETVIRDLEIFETSRRRQSEGSLVRTIDRTLSPMGARMLRYSLANPLVKLEGVAARHQVVSEFVGAGEDSVCKLRFELKNMGDVSRIATRLLAGSASPHELALLRNSLTKANSLSPMLLEICHGNPAVTKVASELVEASDILATLYRVMVDAPEGLGSGRGVFREGVDKFLDEKNILAAHGEAKVQEYEQKLRVDTGISSLKIKTHKSFGLLIEITKTHVAKVPSTFIRRQTMTNGERYTTIELKDLDEDLRSACDHAISRESALFGELLESLRPGRDGLMRVAKAIGELDMLLSFAWLALKENYCRPVLTSAPRRLTLKSCRHPVVEKFVGRHEFMANDIFLNDTKNHLLITGPNMAGKSTVMRQTAIAAVLCQAGAWVPASEAEMPIFDRIFTRVGASDDLSRGQSTFMVEMSEAAEILRFATSKSLVILDEVGRGTSTSDGLAIAGSILDDLAKRVRCFSLFATHYHELVPQAAKLDSVAPMQIEAVEKPDGVIFTHRLVAGASASSFGIEVAKIAGLPSHVIDRARDYLKSSPTGMVQSPDQNFDQNVAPKIRAGGIVGAKAERSEPTKVQKGLFALAASADAQAEQNHGASAILARLESLKINKTNPLQALNILNELKSMLVPMCQRQLFDDQQGVRGVE